MSNHCKGFWSNEMGLHEWTADDQREVDARVAAIRVQKEAKALAEYAEPAVETPVVHYREYFRHGYQPGSFS